MELEEQKIPEEKKVSEKQPEPQIEKKQVFELSRFSDGKVKITFIDPELVNQPMELLEIITKLWMQKIMEMSTINTITILAEEAEMRKVIKSAKSGKILTTN
jgi:hypothetical protein